MEEFQYIDSELIEIMVPFGSEKSSFCVELSCFTLENVKRHLDTPGVEIFKYKKFTAEELSDEICREAKRRIVKLLNDRMSFIDYNFTIKIPHNTVSVSESKSDTPYFQMKYKPEHRIEISKEELIKMIQYFHKITLHST